MMPPGEGIDSHEHLLEAIVNERAYNSLEELFCQLVAAHWSGELKKLKDLL
jgi:hypothetical protein